MSNTLQRIKEFIDNKGIAIKKFERDLGFSNGSFASQLKNDKTIGVDKVEKILQHYPEINPEWLLTGIGAMTKEGRKTTSIEYENDKEIGGNSTLRESIGVYGLEKELSISDPKFKEHLLLNSINNMSQAMITNADTGSINSKNMEKLIDLLTKKIGEENNKDKE